MHANLFLALTLVGPPLAGSEPVDLVGAVLTSDGSPIAGARIYIVTARERTGVSIHCPTCYPDCGKQSGTDRSGAFRIPRLASSLIFETLVVANGFEPTRVEEVDPRKGRVVVRLKPIDPDALKGLHLFRGRVFDPFGQPVRGAVVKPIGWESATSGSRNAADVDALAVSDESGDFLLRSKHGNISLHLMVEAPGFAPTAVERLPVQAERHRIRVVEGVTVSGTVLHRAKPAVGVLVRLVQVDRSSLKFTWRAREVRTDSQGRYRFWNVGAGESYFLCGSMEEADRLGFGLPTTKVKTKEGQELKAVEINSVPCHSILGRAMTQDGKPLPADLTLSVVRRDAWDVKTVPVDREGRFTLVGVPGDRIRIGVASPGNFHLSSENASLGTMDQHYYRIVDVPDDVENLRILIEPMRVKKARP